MTGILKRGFEPIVEPEQFIKLVDPKSGKSAIFKVIFLEQIPEIRKKVTLTAGGTEVIDISELEGGAGELIQSRLKGYGLAEIAVKQPSAVGRFVTKTKQAKIYLPRDKFEKDTEMFTFEAMYPTLEINNLLNVDQDIELVFSGYRFVLDTVPPAATVPKYTVVYISGFSPRAKVRVL